jgi:hypothetical protein
MDGGLFLLMAVSGRVLAANDAAFDMAQNHAKPLAISLDRTGQFVRCGPYRDGIDEGHHLFGVGY